MTDQLDTPRLPPLPKGQDWYVALVEVIRLPGTPSEFFDDDDTTSIGGFLNICLSAPGLAEAEVMLAEHVFDCGAEPGQIEDLRLLEMAIELPQDEDGAYDASLLAAFCDPELGDEIVWGDAYLYSAEDETASDEGQ